MSIRSFLVGAGATGGLIVGGFFLVPLVLPFLTKPAEPVNVSVPAVAAPEVKRAVKKAVTVAKPLMVFVDSTKYDLHLPPAVVKDENEHVLAATQVKGSDRPQTITTVIDEKTGESQTFVKQDPYPWLAIEPHAEVRMAYGQRFSPQAGFLASANTVKTVGRLSFTYDALRVKALTMGVTAHVDTDGQLFLGGGIAYRW